MEIGSLRLGGNVSEFYKCQLLSVSLDLGTNWLTKRLWEPNLFISGGTYVIPTQYFGKGKTPHVTVAR